MSGTLKVSTCQGCQDHLADDPLQLLLREVLVDLPEDLPEPQHGDETLAVAVKQPGAPRSLIAKVFFFFSPVFHK